MGIAVIIGQVLAIFVIVALFKGLSYLCRKKD